MAKWRTRSRGEFHPGAGRVRPTWSLLAMTLAAGLTACSQGTAKPDTGPALTFGLMVDASDQPDTQRQAAVARVAMREINVAGGVTVGSTSYSLDVFSQDHQGTAEGGIAALDAMKAVGVSFSLSPPWSSIALGSDPTGRDGATLAGRDRNILQISGSATSSALSHLDSQGYQWRTAPPDSLQAEIAAKYLARDLGCHTLAIIYRDEAYGQGLASAVALAFQSVGGNVVTQVPYPVLGLSRSELLQADYRSVVATAFAGHPDAVYLASFTETTQIGNTAVLQGYLATYQARPLVLFAGDGALDQDLLTNATSDLLTHISGTAPYPDPASPDFQRFVTALQNAGLGAPDNYDAYRYDAVYTMALAIQKAASLDPSVVKGQVAQVTGGSPGATKVHPGDWAAAKAALQAGNAIDYDGASGPLELLANGGPGVASYAVWRPRANAGGGYGFDYSVTRTASPGP